jgi:hypothetical protein
MPFDVFATRVLYVVTLGVGSVTAVQGDLWWLLRAGKDIWHTHRVPLVDHYSHTAAGAYWPNHEWLWEVCAYALHAVGGMPLIAAWTGGTIAATVVILRHVSAARGYVVPVSVAIALPLLSVTWTARPQVTSLLFFAVTMCLLSQGRDLWLPPLFLLWANVHAQVLIGGVVLATVTVAAAYEGVRLGTADSRARARRLAVVLILSALATLANPLHGRLWTYVLDYRARPGQDRIEEWASAFHPTLVAALFWVPLVGAVALGLRRHRRLANWSARVPAYAALATAPIAALAVRNIPFFVAACLPLFMNLLEFRTSTPIGRVARGRSALAVVAMTTAGCVVAVWASAPPALRWTPVSNGLADALQGCPGPLYNDFNDGAAIVWWVPQVKVFVDNRQDPYPTDVIRAAGNLDARSYPAVFEQWRIDCALVERSTPLEAALRLDGWRATYTDSSQSVLVPPGTPASSAQ